MTKPNTENCKNCSSKCAYDCAQLQYTIQHRTAQPLLTFSAKSLPTLSLSYKPTKTGHSHISCVQTWPSVNHKQYSWQTSSNKLWRQHAIIRSTNKSIQTALTLPRQIWSGFRVRNFISRVRSRMTSITYTDFFVQRYICDEILAYIRSVFQRCELTVKTCPNRNVEESFRKFLDSATDVDDFQNSIHSSLSTDTRLEKFSRRSDQ